MTSAHTATTTVSTKGQVILPSAVRRRQRWDAGTRLTVEETADGVLLRAAPFFPPTTVDEVFGMLKYDGPPVSIEDMNVAVLEGASQRYARSRY